MATTKKTEAAKTAEETTAKKAAATKTAETKTTAAKKTAAKTAEKKTTAAKTTAKKPAVKKVAPKKPAAKATEKVEVIVEFGGVQVAIDEVIKNVKATYGKDVKDLKIYLKPDESKAYFVADGVEGEMNVYFC
ncbi:MAG: DUF6465 family protein [Oscillospiraceae bacterium]|nr:DUF6465 family protein [Oscillospiraceae bacterium]